MADGKIVIDTKLDTSGADKGIKELQNKLSKTGSKLKGIGKKMTKRLTAPLVAAGGIATKFAVEQETAFAKVSTLLDKSTVDYDAYKESIRKASTAMGVSFEDYADAVYNSISASVDQADAIEFTGEAVKLARGGFTDTTTAVDVLTTAINSYGLESKDASKLSDMLITTQNEGKTTVDELASSMGKVIPIAQAQGVSFDQLSTGYAVLTKNGISTAEAGTYLKGMLSELGKSGTEVDKILREKTGKSFSELQGEGKTVSDVLGILQEEADKSGVKLSDMFGSIQGGSAALALAKNDGKEYDDILGGMQESAGATKEAFDKMNETDAEKFSAALVSLQNSAAQLGEIIVPIFAEIADKVVWLAKKFDGLSPGIKKAMVIVGGLIAVLGPLIAFVGMVATGISALAPIFGVLATAMGAIISIPGLIIAAVAALVIAIVVYWDEIVAATKATFSWLSEFFSGLWESITNAASVAWAGFKEIMSGLWNGIVEVGKITFNALIQFFTGLWSKIKDASIALWNAIKSTLVNLWNSLKEKVTSIFNAIMDFIKTTWSTVLGITKATWNTIKSVLTSIWGVIKSTVKSTFNAIKSIIKSIWNGVKSLSKSTWNAIKSVVVSVVNALKSAISSTFNAIKSVVSSIWNGIKSLSSSIWNGIKSSVMGIVNGLKSGISGAFNSIKGIISGAWNGVKGSTDAIWNGITGSVSSAVNGIIGAVNKMINVLNSVKIKMPKIPDWVPGLGGKGGGTIGFNIPNIPSLDVGTNFVAKDGLAMIHQGEAVVPKRYNPAANGGNGGSDKGSTVVVEHMEVRDEKDINKVSRRLRKLQERSKKSKGGGVEVE